MPSGRSKKIGKNLKWMEHISVLFMLMIFTYWA